VHVNIKQNINKLIEKPPALNIGWSTMNLNDNFSCHKCFIGEVCISGKFEKGELM